MTEAEVSHAKNVVAYAESRTDQHWAEIRGHEDELAMIGASDDPIDPADEELVRRACLLVCAELGTRALRQRLEQLETQETDQ